MIEQAQLLERFAAGGFLVGEQMATALELVMLLRKPLLIEGPAGVGKTESAKALADALETRLIRLQCYEGLDASTALYEWNYTRQLLRIRLTEHSEDDVDQREAEIFGEQFLLRRPLLEAISQERAPVLLIDEIDRADEAFEAFLLELLAEFQITIPEMGTITARERPYVILTSNRSRELSDALRRRCLYLWQSYPTPQEEYAILHARPPGLNDRLAIQITAVMAYVRELPLRKVPGLAESLDWAAALMGLHRDALDWPTVERTMGCIIKAREDWEMLATQSGRLEDLLNPRPLSTPVEPDFGLGTVMVRR